MLTANLFPPELTALRAFGLALGVALLAYAIVRRRSLRNADVLILVWAGLALLFIAGTELPDAILSALSFKKGNGGRILGLAVFAIFILFLLITRALSESSKVNRQLSALLEGLAWDEFRSNGFVERFRDKVAVVIPAYNEADSVADVIRQIPPEVCGVKTAVLVVDDGSRDGTGDVAAKARRGRRAPRDQPRRRRGPAHRLPADGRLRRRDRRHPRRRRPAPALGDGAAGQARPRRRGRRRPRLARARPGRAQFARSRELGIVFFNRLVSFITRTHVTDCSNGYRAVRTTVLPQLVLRQEQFHTSEFLIEAIKRGIPAKEVPVTVVKRLHGHSKKPAVVRYGLGFANAIVRTWLR